MPNENLYWLFSSAAQSIAAFVGLVTAGVALASAMLDRLADQDDSLREVIESIRKRQHRSVKHILIFTGIAITFSLLSIYINPWRMLFKSQIYSLAAILDVGVLIGAIIFVVNVLRPDRYNRAAIAEFIAISDKRKPSTKKPTDLFYKDFVDLEKDIRRFLVQHNLYVPSRGIQGMSYSFRQMVEALFLNGKISKELTAQFLEINKFRNLLFHGHIEKIGDDVLDKLKKIRIKWDAAKLQ